MAPGLGLSMADVLEHVGRRLRFWTKRKGLERDLAPGLGLSMADILEHVGRGLQFWTKRKGLERDLAPDLSRWERRRF